MRQIFFWFFLLLCTIKGYSTNYYLSNSGSDLNSGTSQDEPWQSIDKLNSTILQPGDSVFFEAGGIFRGQIIVSNGGTDADPIYFGMYGSGNRPIISGAMPVTNWIYYSGDIYYASLTEFPTQVFVNGKQMIIARYPNSGYLKIGQGMSNTGFIDSTLTQPDGFWEGANVRMRSSDRLWESRGIASFTGDSILFTSTTVNALQSGYGYYFDNLLSLADTAAEWYYETVGQNLYLITPDYSDPADQSVEASVYDYGIIIQNSSSFIVISQIRFEKQKKAGVSVELISSGITVSSCELVQQGEIGIHVPEGCPGCTVQGNQFADIDGLAISMKNADHSEIRENEIRRIGLIPGYGSSSLNNMMAIECYNSDTVTVSENQIDSAGGCGIFVGLTNSLIEKNIFDHCLLRTSNLGSIFIYGDLASACTIQNNFALNTIGNTDAVPGGKAITYGIYLDYNANENFILDNTISFASEGISVGGNSSGNLLRGNLVYGCSGSQLSFKEGSFEGATADNMVTGNTFYSLHEDADVVKLVSSYESFMPAVFDSNYYFNPYAFHVMRSETSPGGSAYPDYYNLQQWRSETGNDTNSKSSFFYRDRLKVTDTVGFNLISNSFFTNNFDGWVPYNDSLEMLLDNSTALDFGCLKLNYISYLPDAYSFVITDGLAIDSGKYYQLTLSNLSTREGNVIVKTQEKVSFGYMTSPRPLPFDLARHDYSIIVQALRTFDNCRLSVELYGSDSIVWIDNITLQMVAGTEEDPGSKSRLFINPTNSSVLVNLNDSIFYTPDQELVNSSFELPSFTSLILIFDSALITSSGAFSPTTTVGIYPNPVSRGSLLHISMSNESPVDELILFDVHGRQILSFESLKTTFIEVPHSILPGVYLVRVRQENDQYIGKLIVH